MHLNEYMINFYKYFKKTWKELYLYFIYYTISNSPSLITLFRSWMPLFGSKKQGCSSGELERLSNCFCQFHLLFVVFFHVSFSTVIQQYKLKFNLTNDFVIQNVIPVFVFVIFVDKLFTIVILFCVWTLSSKRYNLWTSNFSLGIWSLGRIIIQIYAIIILLTSYFWNAFRSLQGLLHLQINIIWRVNSYLVFALLYIII